MPIHSPIHLVALFKSLQVSTNGASTGDDAAKSYLDLQVPQIRNMLPQASGLFVVGLTENAVATDFEWNIQFISGFDRIHEAAPINIAASNLDSASGMRSAEYTTTSNFLLESRLRLWWRNKNGISGVKNAQLSAVLGVHLITA